jgi:large repetitive protein
VNIRFFHSLKTQFANLGFAALLLAAWLLPLPSAHAVYVNRYTTTTNGAITFVGNSLGLDGSTTSGVPGTRGSIGAFITTDTSQRFGSFPFGSTNNWQLNSSTAMVNIPAGSTILYAELVWGGSYSYGGQDVSASLGTAVSFKTPSGTYSIAPAAATSQTLGVPDGAGNCGTVGYCRYVRSANVTGLVQIGQSGTYEVGGVPATANVEPNNNSAGWTLAIVYGNPLVPPRNLTVFVGAEGGGDAPTGVSGFCTNLAGPVKGRLLVSAIEGDTGIVNDQMMFGPNTGAMVPLSGPNNLVGNFFGGQINGDTGALVLSGTFGTSNHNLVGGTTIAGSRQGYDITNVDASSALVNSQTSAVAQGTTGGDQYTINALGIQIDVGAPKFPSTVKTGNRTSTYVGDIITYSVSLDNTAGTAHAANIFFTDTPPPGMSFVAGTVIVNGVSQPTFNPITGFSVGTINAGSVGTVSFQMKVDALPAAPAPATFANKAKWVYDFISCANFPAEAGLTETNFHITPAPRLQPTKIVSPTGAVGVGQTLTYTITVPNTGAANTVGTTLTDIIPAGTTYVAGSTTLNGAVVPDVAGVMPFAAGATINSPTLAAGVIAANASAVVTFKVVVNPSPPQIITNTASIDPDGAGPAGVIQVSALNTPLTPPVVAKSFSPSTIAANTVSTLTILVSNANLQGLTTLAFSDTLPAGVVIANPANVSTTCGSGVPIATPGGITLGLSAAAVPASGSCTVTASVTGASPGVFTNIIPAGAVTTANAGGNVASATAQLTILQGPTINKSFSPSSIASGGTSTLTISIVNPTGVAINNANVTDNLPAGVVVAALPSATSSCAGTFAPAAGSSAVSLTNGVISAANICTMTVNVTSTVVGSYNNIIPAGALTSSGGTNANPALADLNVSAPLISKSFLPTVVGSNVNSVLTITLTNPTNVAASGVTFTDIFPTTPGAMTLTNNTVGNTCGGTITDQASVALAAGSTSVKLVGGAINAGGSCTMTFNVMASTGGSYVNTIPIGGLSTTNIGSNTLATTATLAVGLPKVEKVFGTFAAPITSFAVGNSFQVSIRVTNPNSTALNITSVTDNLPAGMTVFDNTTSNSCGGTLVDQAGGALSLGDTVVKQNGGSIAANSSCTYTFRVVSNASNTYVNTLALGDLVTSAGNNAFAASATVNVLVRPSIVKVFSPTTISPTGVSTLTITLTNTNPETLTSAGFTDTFPTTPGAMTLANTTTTNTCGGTLLQSNNSALVAGATSIKLTAGSIPGNGSCQITVQVTATTAGLYTNTIASVATNNGGSSTVGTTATLNVQVLPPSISKAFAVSPVGKGVPTRLTFTVNNPNASLALTGLTFNDVFPTIPSAMVVAPNPNILVNGCGAGFTFAPTAGASSVSFTGGSIAIGASCQVSVDVVAAVAGSYNNVSGTVGSTNAGTGNTASATLRVLDAAFVSKAFANSPISVGAVTSLTLTISNPNASDALSGVSVNDTYPPGLINSASPNPQVTCSGGSSAAFTGGAVGGNNIGLTSGALAPGGFCSLTVNVTATQTGNIDNLTGNTNSTNAGSGNTATARLVVGVDVSGFVYADSNTNSIKDGAEAGTGLSLFAKLINAGVVQQAVAVNTVSGAYVFVAVMPGNYTVVIDNNNLTTDMTPTLPSGWTGTEMPTQMRSVSVSSTAVANQNFGLNNGARISGRVFQDNGIGGGGGIGNDGIANGAEQGIANVTVKLTNCSATTYATTTTDGGGIFNFVVPVTVLNGTSVCVVQTAPSGFLETGGTIGTTSTASGSYTRSNSTIAFIYATGVSQSGLSFGNVPVNTLNTDGVQTALPGTSVNYTHAFVAGSSGLVTFTATAISAPTLVGWSEVIYRDTNCNGQIDVGEPTVTAGIAVVAGEQVCLVVKEFIPAAAPIGAQNVVTLTANFAYTNAVPLLSASLSRTDTTTVGNSTSSGLRLTKSVNQATALPGATLIYTITYRNDSTGPLSTLLINDATPAFTTFLSAACAPVPATLTGCSVSSSPAVGALGSIVWTFTGTLAPTSQGTVTFSVQVNP